MKPKLFWIQIWWYKSGTVKLGFNELLNKEQIDNWQFPVTNLPVYLINSEQICDDQKVPLNAKFDCILFVRSPIFQSFYCLMIFCLVYKAPSEKTIMFIKELVERFLC